MLQTFANRFNSHASKSIPATDPESVGKGAIGICRQNSHQRQRWGRNPPKGEYFCIVDSAISHIICEEKLIGQLHLITDD